jgi:MATE family multidrug resistance protein
MMNKNSPIDEPRWESAREVMVMSFPIILGSLSFTIMEFVDRKMVSELGTAPLAAVGSAGLWSYIFSCVLLGVIGCISTFAAQSLGQKKTENCSRYTWQGFYMSLASILIALILLPASWFFFRLMQHSEAVTHMETTYFQIRLLGYAPMAWSTALAAFFTAVNRSWIPMVVAVIANMLNIFLDYVLIFGELGFPRLEIAGAAWGTVLAQTLHVLLLHYVFVGKAFHQRYNTRRTWRYDHKKILELVRIGVPNGVLSFLDIASWGVFVSFVVGYFGDNALAANNVATSIMMVSFMPAVAMNQGIAAIVGQWIGKQDIARAKKRTFTAVRLCIAYMFLMGLCFAIFGRQIVGFFSPEPEIIALGYQFLILAAIFQGFDAINIVCMGALRGAGDTQWMMKLALVFGWLLFLPSATVLAFVAGLGAVGAWLGATVYIIALSGIIFWRFNSERWRNINIFSESTAPVTAAPALEGETP